MELLEKFNLITFTEEEKLLLQLAVIYHDAAAEDATKQQEEQQSAYYFSRDLQGKFPQHLLSKVALALEYKEDDILEIKRQNTDQSISKYLEIIRFADRMDYIRCSSISSDFPNFNDGELSSELFNANILNLPTQEQQQFSTNNDTKTLFQRNLEAAMHGAVDLAAVAGGYNEDLREKGSYEHRYKLNIDNQRIKIAFERTDSPITQLTELLDNNVRRLIAKLAGINTCTYPKHLLCMPDIKNGVIRGIHSTWNDLNQIKILENMTLLEKMQCEHDFKILSQTTLDAINLEVARLIENGLQMSLGTLTQDTLKSDAVRKVLNERGFDVINESRHRGYNLNGDKQYQDMLVLESLNKPNMQ
jgi:hypothetical protein